MPGAPPTIRLVADVSRGEWRMPAGDYGNLRYSTLDTITTTNVMNLHVVTTFSTGIPHGHEGQPLVFGNTMYVVTPFPNNLIAVDLTKPGGAVKWIYEPHPDPRAVGIACCDVVNRGASYADGKIIYSLLDATVVAVDVETGQEVWRTKVGDINRGETFTAAPIVVKDHVHRRQLGRRARRARLRRGARRRRPARSCGARSTPGPDSDVKIGAGVPRLLRKGPGEGPRRHVVAGRAMEARRLDGLGLDLVRPRNQSVLLRHRQPRRLESRTCGRATTSGRPRSSRATPTPARRGGPIR